MIFPRSFQKCIRVAVLQNFQIVSCMQPCDYNSIKWRQELNFNPLFLHPMKFFGFIISFYLLGLSCLPCGDGNDCNLKPAQAISAATDHEKHRHDFEHCTPFCTCSCCATSVVKTDISIFTSGNLPLNSVKNPALISSFFPQMSYAIWQPPKLS